MISNEKCTEFHLSIFFFSHFGFHSPHLIWLRGICECLRERCARELIANENMNSFGIYFVSFSPHLRQYNNHKLLIYRFCGMWSMVADRMYHQFQFIRPFYEWTPNSVAYMMMMCVACGCRMVGSLIGPVDHSPSPRKGKCFTRNFTFHIYQH